MQNWEPQNSHSSPVTLWKSARLWVRRGPQHLGHTKAWGIFFRLASCFSKQMMKALVRKMGRTNTGIMAENGNFHSTAEKDKNNLLLVVYFIVTMKSCTQLFFQKSWKMLGLRSLFYKCRERITDLPKIRLLSQSHSHKLMLIPVSALLGAVKWGFIYIFFRINLNIPKISLWA